MCWRGRWWCWYFGFGWCLFHALPLGEGGCCLPRMSYYSASSVHILVAGLRKGARFIGKSLASAHNLIFFLFAVWQLYDVCTKVVVICFFLWVIVSFRSWYNFLIEVKSNLNRFIYNIVLHSPNKNSANLIAKRTCCKWSRLCSICRRRCHESIVSTFVSIQDVGLYGGQTSRQ